MSNNGLIELEELGAEMSTNESRKPPKLASTSAPSGNLRPPPLPTNANADSQKTLLIGISTILAGILILALLLLMQQPPQKMAADGDTQEEASGDETKNVAGEREGADAPIGIDLEEDGSNSNQAELGETVSAEAPLEVAPNADEEQEMDRDDKPLSVEELPSVTEPTSQLLEEDEQPQDSFSRKKPNRFFTLGGERDSEKSVPLKSKSRPLHTAGGRGLEGRHAGSKADLLKAYGGTPVTEAAVKLGLEWLSRNQRSDGLWSLRGPYANAANQENIIAASSMALLAFQGAGHTPKGDKNEPFTQVVAKGWNGLLQYLDAMRESREFHGLHRGYTEAICTIALCELYGMTKDRRYRKPAMEAVNYCVGAQSAQGGWRYTPNTDSDTSVTGWYVMALQSARMAGFSVDKHVLQKATGYLDNTATHSGARYSYQPGSRASRAMTAEGLLCRQYLGWKHDDPRLIGGTTYLVENLPNWNDRDVYYWYYATQVTHHMEEDYWKKWNAVTSTLLPEKQLKEGVERGSWDPQGDKYGSAGGRLYVTALSLYMLEVYYRYLPIYQKKAVATAL